LFVLIGAVGLVCSISGNAFAKAPAQPKITATAATFNVPGGSTAVWTLRLWSHGTLEGKDTGTSGTLTVPVPVTADCFFQADVQATTVKGLPFYFSGSRATVPGCGVGPPVGTIAGHIYLCAAGSPTTTEATGGTLAVTPDVVTSQPNPITPTAVTAGSYTMTAGSPDGLMFVLCGGSATISSDGQSASESVTVPSGGAGVGIFYATSPPVAAGGGSTGNGSTSNGPTGNGSSVTEPAVTAVVAASSSSKLPSGAASPTAGGMVTPASSSGLAFTGMDTAQPLFLGLALLFLGTVALLFSRARRLSPRPARTGPETRPASRRTPPGGPGLRHRSIRVGP
jgi:hypothetical protein